MLWLLLVCGSFLTQQGATTRKSGPFDVVLDKLDKCPDSGTDESVFPTKMIKVSREKTVLNDTFRLSPGMDERSMMDIELQEWGNQGYRPRTVQIKLKTCNKILKEGGYIVKQLFQSAGYNVTGCPIPAGNYSIRDLVWDLHPNRMPVLIYNSYRCIASLFYDNRKVGCIRLYGRVVPKGST